MNREQLLDAIGQADESLLKETEQLRMNADNTDTSAKITSISTHRPARRRIVFILAACLVLTMCAVAAAATGFFRHSGTVTIGTDDKGNSAFSFAPDDEDMRLPLSAFTGDIRNVGACFDEYYQRSQGVEFSYPDPRYSVNGFSPSDDPLVPFLHLQGFNTPEEGKAYIGYDPLIIPEFLQAYTPDWVYAAVLGWDEDWFVDNTIEPDFRLGHITFNSQYTINGIHVSVIDYLITEAFESPRASLMTSITDGDFTSSTEIVNNREFQVVTHNNSGNYPGMVVKEYIWAENKVEYHLIISYNGASDSDANAIVQNWMNSFGN